MAKCSIVFTRYNIDIDGIFFPAIVVVGGGAAVVFDLHCRYTFV